MAFTSSSVVITNFCNMVKKLLKVPNGSCCLHYWCLLPLEEIPSVTGIYHHYQVVSEAEEIIAIKKNNQLWQERKIVKKKFELWITFFNHFRSVCLCVCWGGRTGLEGDVMGEERNGGMGNLVSVGSTHVIYVSITWQCYAVAMVCLQKFKYSMNP